MFFWIALTATSIFLLGIVVGIQMTVSAVELQLQKAEVERRHQLLKDLRGNRK